MRGKFLAAGMIKMASFAFSNSKRFLCFKFWNNILRFPSRMPMPSQGAFRKLPRHFRKKYFWFTESLDPETRRMPHRTRVQEF